MAHFTQLGLSGSPDKTQEVKPQGKIPPNVSLEGQYPQSNTKKASSTQKTAALVGSLIATALLGFFVFESGCSKESDKPAAIAAPNQTAVTQPPTPTSAVPISTPMPIASQPPAKKKSRQRKLSASAYTNSAYGVSFHYPKSGSLKEGDEANLELDGLGPVEMNFVQAGGTTISAVELPRTLFAGTDFNTAFFNVSVNPKLSSAECEQFAFPETRETDPVSTKTKIGSAELRAVEGFAEEENRQADGKYYHVFQNESCYEFALGLETVEPAHETNSTVKPALKPVNRNEVFRRLNWILSTVKIQPVAAPGKTIPEVATDTSPSRTDAAMTEAH
jgi:hypothetical protein